MKILMKYKSIYTTYVCPDCKAKSDLAKYGMAPFAIDKIYKQIETRRCYQCNSQAETIMDVAHIRCEVIKDPQFTIEWCCRTCKTRWKERIEKDDLWDTLILEHLQATTTCPNGLCKNSDVTIRSL